MLGVRYLWIGSFCIVQGCDEDWQNAAASMADIYQNGYLTLAASAAESDDADSIRGLPSAFTSFPKHIEIAGVTCGHSVWRSSHRSALDIQPSSTRAWCMQERSLSPRVLRFSPGEVWWESRSGVSCECVHPQIEATTFHRDLPEPLKRTDEKSRLTSTPSRLDDSDSWHHLVQICTKLSLTMDKDTFPAIAGIARRMWGGLHDEYVAGLWKSTLDVDLCWQVNEPTKRPTTWRAPTWSWA